MILALLTAAFASPSSAALSAYAVEFHQDRVSVADDALKALHATACEAGSMANCDRGWKTGDLMGAAKALTGSCEEGDHAACTVVGWSLVQTLVPGKIDEQFDNGPAAIAYFSAACKAGLERACVEEGILLTRGVEGAAGLDRALPLFQTACQVGDLAGCRRLGGQFHSGQGIGRDLDKARLYYGKACDGGYVAGCNGLALIDHLGVGTKRAPVAAEANYIKACDAGHGGACANLDKLYRNGVNPDLDPAAALTVWSSGCERKVPAACANAGRLAGDSVRNPNADPALARTLLQKGCDLGDAFTCGLLGKQLVVSDPDRGVGLLENSCIQGIAPACSDLADLLWEGDVLKKDKKRARVLYTTACATYEPACERAR